MGNVSEIQFPNECPNCGNKSTQESGYDYEYGILSLEVEGHSLKVVHVICNQCGFVRTFKDNAK